MSTESREAALLRTALDHELADLVATPGARAAIRRRSRPVQRQRKLLTLFAATLVPVAAAVVIVLLVVSGTKGPGASLSPGGSVRPISPAIGAPQTPPPATTASPPAPTPPVAAFSTGPPTSVTVTMRTTSKQVGQARVTQTLPVLSGGSDARDTTANAAIEAAAGSTRKNSDPMITDITVSSSVLFQNANVISIRLASTITFTGAAHPDNGLAVITLNLASGAELDPSAFFTDQAAVLRMIAATATTDLVRQFGASQLFAAGLTPTPAHYALLAPTTAGLRVDFPYYQVGNRSVSDPDVVIPWTQVDRFLTGPAARAFGRS